MGGGTATESGDGRPTSVIGRGADLVRVLHAVRPGGVAGAIVDGPPGSGVSHLLDLAARDGVERGWRIGRIVACEPHAERLDDVEPLIGRTTDLLDARRRLDEVGYDLLVVDDADLLEPTSAELLRHAVLDGSCRLLAGTHELAEHHSALTSLWRSGRLERVDLEALTDSAAHELLTEILGGPIEARSAQRLVRLGAGRPLLLVELTRAATATGQLSQRAGLWRLEGWPRLGPGLCELAGELVGSLEPDLDDAVDLLAVGGSVPLDLLRAALGEEVVDRLERRGLVTTQSRLGGPVVELQPALAGLARAQSLGPIRRRRLAERLLTEADGRMPSGQEVLRARWALDAGVSLSDDDLVAAGRQAHFLHDLDLAALLAEAAPDRTEAQHLLGLVRHEQGRSREAARIHAAIAGDPDAPAEIRVLAAMEWSSLLLWSLADADGAVAVAAGVHDELRREPEAVSDDELSEVAAFHAAQLLFSGAVADGLCAATSLHETASGRGRAETCMVVAAGLAVAGDCQRAVTVAEEGLDVRRALGDQLTLTGVEIHRVDQLLALLTAGRLVEADEVADDSLEEALGRGSELAPGWVSLAASLVALHRGALGRADELARRATLAFEVLDQRGAGRWGVAAQLLAAAYQSDAERSAALAERLTNMGWSGLGFFEPEVRRAEAWGEVAAGRRSRADALLREAAELAAESGQHALEANAWHDLTRLGSADGASERLTQLVDVVDSHLSQPRAQHARALTEGDHELLFAVAETYDAVGSPLWAAEAAAQASVLLAMDGQASRSRTVAARSAQWRSQTEGAATPALVDMSTAELSPREREVAALAAAGLTSRQVATELDISVRTVDNLLHRTYGKLGLSGRAELAQLLTTNGAADIANE